MNTITFPLWLQEQHERNGYTMYSVGSDAIYCVLELTGDTVTYSFHGGKDGTETYRREFKSPKSAANFYLKCARCMKRCAERRTIPLWHNLN